MSLPRHLAALAVLALALTACGSSSGPRTTPSSASVATAVRTPSTAATPTLPATATASGSSNTAASPLDPCSLLSAQDAKAVDLGYPGRPNHDLAYGPSCNFSGTQITLFDADTSDAAFRFGATKPISGLGDEAFYGAEDHWVRVKKAATRFEVRCPLCEQATEEQMMIKVAQKVLTHIPG